MMCKWIVEKFLHICWTLHAHLSALFIDSPRSSRFLWHVNFTRVTLSLSPSLSLWLGTQTVEGVRWTYYQWCNEVRVIEKNRRKRGLETPSSDLQSRVWIVFRAYIHHSDLFKRTTYIRHRRNYFTRKKTCGNNEWSQLTNRLMSQTYSIFDQIDRTWLGPVDLKVFLLVHKSKKLSAYVYVELYGSIFSMLSALDPDVPFRRF